MILEVRTLGVHILLAIFVRYICVTQVTIGSSNKWGEVLTTFKPKYKEHIEYSCSRGMWNNQFLFLPDKLL